MQTPLKLRSPVSQLALYQFRRRRGLALLSTNQGVISE